jgi:hypothetical protein
MWLIKADSKDKIKNPEELSSGFFDLIKNN